MSYYVADATGYLADAASVRGWSDFATWAEGTQASTLLELIEHGYTRKPGELLQELLSLSAPDPTVESTRKDLCTAVLQAKDIVIISDGTGGLEAPTTLRASVLRMALDVSPRKRIDRLVADHAPRLERHVKRAFAEGRKALNLKSFSTAKATAGAAAAAVAKALAPGLDKMLSSAAMDGGHFAATRLSQERTLNALIRSAAIAEQFGFGEKNQAAIDWAKEHAGTMVDGIEETTQKAIQDAIAAALDGDIDFDDAVESISSAVGDAARAELIAQHEIHTAVNEGQREAWDQAIDAGMLDANVQKTIILSDKPCEICEGIEADGPIGIQEQYDVDGEPMDGPPFHVRCECTEGIVG